MKTFAALTVLSFFSVSAFATSKDCKKEAEHAQATCDGASTTAFMNNNTLAAAASSQAGSGGIMNDAGAYQNRISQTGSNNMANAAESCRQQRKKVKEECQEAYKSEEANKNDPAVKKQINENYEWANKKIGESLNNIYAEKANLDINGVAGGSAVAGATAKSR